ncbi:hypothetical protein SAMN05216326_11122 [Nitrosomonas marina]|uniref:LysM domain-containing protein n=1 Tax=Nitrosomonas marina TaxID=917 RepID=A0A1I0BKV3_9PROT|nr:hypothetical protein [Nitrosomonas marina]SET07212.1 hypothetical protein SAMN05216326_11122 [Nitrosomonas marina]
MLLKKSRYRNAGFFQTENDGDDVFPGVRAREIGPAAGMIEHEIQAGNRLDQLARHYYNDDRLWWRIVDANPAFLFAGDMLDETMQGSVLLIPRLKE